MARWSPLRPAVHGHIADRGRSSGPLSLPERRQESLCRSLEPGPAVGTTQPVATYLATTRGVPGGYLVLTRAGSAAGMPRGKRHRWSQGQGAAQSARAVGEWMRATSRDPRREFAGEADGCRDGPARHAARSPHGRGSGLAVPGTTAPPRSVSRRVTLAGAGQSFRNGRAAAIWFVPLDGRRNPGARFGLHGMRDVRRAQSGQARHVDVVAFRPCRKNAAMRERGRVPVHIVAAYVRHGDVDATCAPQLPAA
jgi:hypothetical protein